MLRTLGLAAASLLVSACASGHRRRPPASRAVETPTPRAARPWTTWLPASQNGKVGFVDTDGRLRIPAVFDFAWRFSTTDERARVVLNRRIGYVDATGTVVISPRWFAGGEFVEAHDFSEGLAGVSDERGDAFIDVAGREVLRLPRDWRTEAGFHGGLALVRGNHARPGGVVPVAFIDRRGTVINDAWFDMAVPFDERWPVTLVTQDDRYGVVDRGARWVVPPRFVSMCAASWPPWAEGPVAVLVDHLWGFIDQKGAFVIPPSFAQTSGFSEGLASVGVAARNAPDAGAGAPSLVVEYGYIDGRGAFVVAPSFVRADPFHEGMAAVSVSDANGRERIGYIDHSGAMVVPARFSNAREFHHGLAAVSQDGSGCGYIDRTGAWAIPPAGYDDCEPFDGTSAMACVGQTTNSAFEARCAYFNRNGRKIAELAHRP